MESEENRYLTSSTAWFLKTNEEDGIKTFIRKDSSCRLYEIALRSVFDAFEKWEKSNE